MTTGTLVSFKLEVETPIYYKFVISFVTQKPVCFKYTLEQ